MIGDDHGFPDYGFMGSPHVQTPNLDALAAAGAVFPFGHTTGSECRPSLLTLLTGLYPYQWCHRVAELEREDAAFDEGSAITRFDTLPRLLAERGYVSFQGGKHWEGTHEDAGYSAGMTATQDPESPWSGSGARLGRESMQPVFDFVDAHRERPFFVWFAPMLPHIPHDAPQRHLARYEGQDLSDSARRYYASCSWYDELVGELVQHLEQRGLGARTLLVYVSDNGWDQPPRIEFDGNLGQMMGGPRGKGSLHGMGVRTPLVFHGPGRVPGGRVIDELVSTVDLVPTLLDYAGVDVPAELPGRSLRPVLEGGEGPGREVVVGSAGRVRAKRVTVQEPSLTRPTRAFWARSRRWHYVRNESRDVDRLYAMGPDLDEGRADVADRHPDVVEQMRSAVEAWKVEVLRPFGAAPDPDVGSSCAVNRGGA